MPPVYRFIEIIVYSLLNFLPFPCLGSSIRSGTVCDFQEALPEF